MLNIKTRHGFTLCVPENLSVMTTFVLSEQESWFEDEVDFISKLILPGESVIDIGANHGVYTIALAKKLAADGIGGRVLAFEPNASLHPYIQASLNLNDLNEFVVLFSLGLSRNEGSSVFHIPANSELASLIPVEGANQAFIDLTSLDIIVEKVLFADEKIGIIKMDAEGAEIDIIEGAVKFFQQHQPVVMFEVKHGATMNIGLADAFVSMGYDLYRYVKGLDVLLPYKSYNVLDGYQLNLFAIPPCRYRAFEKSGLLLKDLPSVAKNSFPIAIETVPGVSVNMKQSKKISSSLQNAIAYISVGQCLDYDKKTRYSHILAARNLLHELKLESGDEADEAIKYSALARVWWLLGERTAMVKELQHLMTFLGSITHDQLPIAISPHPAFDCQPVRTDIVQWLQCACYEAIERMSRYSSYFGAHNELLLSIYANPHHTLEMERRLALSWVMQGRTLQIHRNSALCSNDGSGQHLNPHLWIMIANGILYGSVRPLCFGTGKA
ncbi:FkbM family methyltransferase [Chlorobium limicola]